MIHIAFCTDTNYVMPTGVAMISICENNQEEEITFHLVITDEGTSADEVEKKVQPLLDIASKYGKHAQTYRLEKKNLSKYVCKAAPHVSTTGFARMFLPTLLKDIEKVLYLDSDIVVLENISDLWNTCLDANCPLAGVVDVHSNSGLYHEIVKTEVVIPYINSGVLLINLDCWRKNNYTKSIIDCIGKNDFLYLDQDALNFFFNNSILQLPIKYNVQTHFFIEKESNWLIPPERMEEARISIKKPTIIHYVMGIKPWTIAPCPKKEVWNSYKNLSFWKDEKEQIISVPFHRSIWYKKLEDAFYADQNLFSMSINHFLSVFSASIKLKHKTQILRLAMFFPNTISRIVTIVYKIKKNG